MRREDDYVQYIDLARVAEEAPMAYVEALSWHSFGFVEWPREANSISNWLSPEYKSDVLPLGFICLAVCLRESHVVG
jgi:hypothetical protein